MQYLTPSKLPTILLATLVLCLATANLSTAQTLKTKIATPDYNIEHGVAATSDKDTWFTQARGSILPGNDKLHPSVIITFQKTGRKGSHDYRNFYQVQSDDLGKTWSEPRILHSMKRTAFNDRGDQLVIGDFWPKLHEKTGVVFGTGKTFTFRGGKKEDKTNEKVSYSVYNPVTQAWNGLQVLELPKKDHSEAPILEQNAGCTQRVDLPDGDVLLPIRYRRDGDKGRCYVSAVARCGFDGKKLTYKEHGTELQLKRDRGFCEPSLAEHQGRFFLTLRADHTGFVTRSDDGLNFEPVKEWTFDDGKPLGSYNTQQHWVTHPGGKGLFLVYTRKGANNDHIMRHRAPLFIAQVDPDRLCVLRDTERVLLPENNATLGNFGITEVSPKETWVVAAEYPRNKRKNDSNQTHIAKIIWKE